MPRRKLPKSTRRSSSRTAAPPKRKSRKLPARRKKSSRSNSSSSGNWLQSVIAWLVIAGVGLGISWYVLVWGVVPAMLRPILANQTIAVVPEQAEGAVLVVHFGTELKRSSAYILNGEEIVNLPGKYGDYKLSAVYPLLQLEQKEQRYLIGSMNRVSGVFLSQVIESSTTLESDRKKSASQIINLFWQRLMQGKLEPTLLGTWYVLKSEQLVNSTSTIADIAPDLEKSMGGTFAARDECSIAILNSTDRSGLAGRLSDIVEKNGGVVIRLGQYSENIDNSVLLYDPSVAACAQALEQVATLSPVPFEIKEDSTVQSTFRAPIVAIIGENFE